MKTNFTEFLKTDGAYLQDEIFDAIRDLGAVLKHSSLDVNDGDCPIMFHLKSICEMCSLSPDDLQEVLKNA